MARGATDGRPAILGGSPIRPQGPPDWPGFDPRVALALDRALRDGTWGKYKGPHTEQLVARLAAEHGVPHVVLCASGTAAIELALRGLGVGAGDEVLLAAYDFQANFQNVLTVGAIPVLVDLRPDDWQLDAGRIRDAITPATKALLVSHLHGGVVDMPDVAAVAREFGVCVIEDACQALGATIHGRIAGTWGDVGVLSFGGSKLVSAGRGGALVTPRDDVAQRIRLYTQRGNEAYPLSEVQAACVLPQWEALVGRHAQRAQAVNTIVHRLMHLSGIRPFACRDGASRPAYYKLGFQYAADAFEGLSRDEFAAAVRAEGVALDPGFRALHKIHSSRRFRASGGLAVATAADLGVLTLHHPVFLEGAPAIEEVVLAIERTARHAAAIRDARQPPS